jgi:hypothetical protein
MADEPQSVKIDFAPRIDHENGPFNLEPLYVNFGEVTSNQYEVRVALGRLPMRMEPGEVAVPKMVELILPPMIAEQLAQMIFSNVAAIRQIMSQAQAQR